MTTTDVNKAWFGTGRWDKERRALPLQAKQELSTLEHLARAANSCRNNQPNLLRKNQEQVFLYITDLNPELEELSLQLR